MELKSDLCLFQEWLKSDGFQTGSPGYNFIERLAEETESMLGLPTADRTFDRENIYGSFLNHDKKPKGTKARQNALASAAEAGANFFWQSASRYREFLENSGAETCVVLKVLEGGGRNKPTLYWLDSAPISAISDVDPDIPAHGEQRVLQSPNDRPIRYSRAPFEEIKLSWVGKLAFGKGSNSVDSLRAKMHRHAIFIQMLIPTIPLFVFLLTAPYNTRPFTVQTSATLLMSLMAAGYLWFEVFRPLNTLASRRMMLLRDRHLASDEPPTQLEKVNSLGDPDRVFLRVSRYKATCPYCGGKVDVVDGGKAWPDRFVGSCINSPTEHVFSFDRMTMLGLPLRAVALHPKPLPHVEGSSGTP